MGKTFYTERDIEDMVRQGVKSLVVDDNTVLTELAREKARRLGLELLNEQDSRPSSAPARPYIAEVQHPKPNTSPENATSPKADLESRVFSSVKARLGDQVDDALLRTIVQLVIKGLGGK